MAHPPGLAPDLDLTEQSRPFWFVHSMLFRLLRDLFFSTRQRAMPRSRDAVDTGWHERFAAAQFAQQSGDLAGAARAYEALSALPGAPRLAANLWAELEVERGNLQQARTALELLAGREGSDARAAYTRARVLQAEGQFMEALRLAELSLSAPELLGRAALVAAQCHDELGRPDAALRLARQAALAGEPLSDAVSAAALWSTLAPDDEAALAQHARLCAASGCPADGWRIVQPALSGPTQSMAMREAAADIADAIGETNEAEKLYRALHEQAPSEPKFCIGLARSLHRLGDWQAAENLLSTWLAVNPDSEDAWFQRGLSRFELGDWAGAAEDFRWAHAARRGTPWNDAFEARIRSARPRRNQLVNQFKLLHDAEQFEYLVDEACLPASAEDLADVYDVQSRALEPDRDFRPVQILPEGTDPLIRRSLQRPVYVPLSPRLPNAVISASLDRERIEADYRSARPEMTFFDGLLSDDALHALREFCLKATVWNNLKNGYLGAYLHDGFSSPLLLQIASELRGSLPGIFGDLPLSMLWAYKYDNWRSGIGLHADQAVVNVNFWITPDDGHHSLGRGGLVVYPWEPPSDWGAVRYNQRTADVMAALKAQQVEPVIVPYKQNRAVIFNSKLFHHTDEFEFGPRYEDRRINVTMLFGYASG